MTLNPLRLIVLTAALFLSFSGEVVFASTMPVQGYIGKAGSGTSSNFSLSSNFGTQYKYIQLDIDPVVVTPPTSTGSGGGGPSGLNTTNTRYKTQICQCDGGGNASCVNAFVQDVATQECIEGTSDTLACLTGWADSKGYNICSTVSDCACGDEPLLPSAPAEPNPETPTEEVPEETEDPEIIDNEVPTEIETPTPVIPDETAPETETETPSEEAPAIKPQDIQTQVNKPTTPSEPKREDKDESYNFNSLDLNNGAEQSLFGQLYGEQNKKLHFYEEDLYGSAPSANYLKCGNCQRIWFDSLRVNICFLFWIALILLIISIITNVILFRKHKKCHRERKFLLKKTRIKK